MRKKKATVKVKNLQFVKDGFEMSSGDGFSGKSFKQTIELSIDWTGVDPNEMQRLVLAISDTVKKFA